MGRRHDHQGHVRNHPLESIDGSGDLTTIPPHPYGEDDILTEVKRQHREDGNNRQRHVTFGNVMIEGGDVIGTSRVDEEVEFGDAGDVLSSELDREVLNTILETGTDEKGRRVLKERYAKLNPEARRQREIRLAQYSGFAMRSDGTLDYGIDNSPLPKKPSFMKKLLNRLV
jgi:hypothetical protein